MTRYAVNGISLNAEVSGDGPALLMLHGFTGNLDTWSALLPDLPDFRSVRVDLIGHGGSDAPADPSRYTMAHAVDDLLALLDRLGIERVGLIGYSLGGRVALHFALAAPERLWALVLESASTGIEDYVERDARRQSDEALANDIERDGIEAFVDRWQALPLWASQASLPQEKRDALRRQRLTNSTSGLANSLRGMGAGAQDYLGDRLAGLRVPTLAVAGSHDTKYATAALGLVRKLPDCEAVVVPDAGHAVHLEQPEAFSDLVSRFLRAHVPE
jgi:2-succinyl-6-hydroxy-2,4-cyclohexadiene-1-carboxylate synthase